MLRDSHAGGVRGPVAEAAKLVDFVSVDPDAVLVEALDGREAERRPHAVRRPDREQRQAPHGRSVNVGLGVAQAVLHRPAFGAHRLGGRQEPGSGDPGAPAGRLPPFRADSGAFEDMNPVDAAGCRPFRKGNQLPARQFGPAGPLEQAGQGKNPAIDRVGLIRTAEIGCDLHMAGREAGEAIGRDCGEPFGQQRRIGAVRIVAAPGEAAEGQHAALVAGLRVAAHLARPDDGLHGEPELPARSCAVADDMREQFAAVARVRFQQYGAEPGVLPPAIPSENLQQARIGPVFGHAPRHVAGLPALLEPPAAEQPLGRGARAGPVPVYAAEQPFGVPALQRRDEGPGIVLEEPMPVPAPVAALRDERQPLQGHPGQERLAPQPVPALIDEAVPDRQRLALRIARVFDRPPEGACAFRYAAENPFQRLQQLFRLRRQSPLPPFRGPAAAQRVAAQPFRRKRFRGERVRDVDVRRKRARDNAKIATRAPASAIEQPGGQDPDAVPADCLARSRMAADGAVPHRLGNLLQAGARQGPVQSFEPGVHADQQLQGPAVHSGDG